MEQINHLLVAMQTIMPAEAWLVALGGPTASIITGKFNKWLSIQKKWMKVLITLTVAFLETAGVYIIGQVQQNPGVLGEWYPLIALSSIVFYQLIGKPISGIIKDAKEFDAGTGAGPQLQAAAAAAGATGVAAGVLADKAYSAPDDNSDVPEFSAI